MPAAKLLLDHLDLLTKLEHSLPVLDLACGTGQNGLMLARRGTPVVFSDRSSRDLETIDRHLTEEGLPGNTWNVDLEQPGVNPLSNDAYSAIIVFRYLHRPLFPALINAVIPGGLVVYETFTIANQPYGRPNNPDFLLQPGELTSVFQEWETIYEFEGMLRNPDRIGAQIVARKPF